MPAPADTPRDLLFGLLALHNGLIDQSALVRAFHTWTRAEGRPMAEILVEQGAIDVDQRFLLEALALQHIKKYAGDAEKSLAAIGVGPSTRQKLAELVDADLTQSLASVGVTSLEEHSDTTLGYAVGTSTSAGQRFRVLRPHARGGLGAVFVALDVELNREVALKEILEPHADNPIHRAKFLVEAEITGGLEHPGIVPVYGLGHYDNGRPYYAMRFVKGDNLKQAIARFHADETLRANPGPRSLALHKLLRRFTDVCNAIEYAHSRGVLHRDIKPGNVIVGSHGETLVVDWGLAKAKVRDSPNQTAVERTLIPLSASGSAETRSGQVLGTPAYMSPEQASGDLDRLGPRSDVYSLGATLYNLLTGKNPFEGDVASVLRDVVEGRFTRPRAIDPTIDPAVEALCLKAMARRPEDRYAGPKALAEDLDRWSADEPVLAYAEPWARRARRWATRNRTAVTSAAVALVVAVFGLASVLAVQSRANVALNEKNGELTRAKEKVDTQNTLLVEANERESKANAELKAANDQVQSRFVLAQEAIRSFSQAVSQDEMLKEDNLRPLRDKLLRSAADFYGKLGKLLEGRPDQLSRIALGKAYFELGDMTHTNGDHKVALEIYQKALATHRALAEADPASLQFQADLAKTHHNISALLESTGESAKALESCGRALEIRRRLADAEPANTQFQADLAQTHHAIGWALARTGESSKATESYGRALAIQRRLAEADPSVTKFQADLATTYNDLGILRTSSGEPAKALESFDQSLAIRRRLAEVEPNAISFQSDLALSYNNIGYILAETGEKAKAMQADGKSLEIRRRLAEANPSVTRFQAELAMSYNNTGYMLENTGKPAQAVETYGRGLAVQRRLAEAYPTVARFQSDLARSQFNLAFQIRSTGEPANALELHNRVVGESAAATLLDSQPLRFSVTVRAGRQPRLHRCLVPQYRRAGQSA